MAVAPKELAKAAIPKVEKIRQEINYIREKIRFFASEIEKNQFNSSHDVSNMRYLASDINLKLLPNFKDVRAALQSLAGAQALIALEESMVEFFNGLKNELAVRASHMTETKGIDWHLLVSDFHGYCVETVKSIDAINRLFTRIIMRLSQAAQRTAA